MRATSPSLFVGTRCGLFRWQDGVVAPLSHGSDAIVALLPLRLGRLLVATEGSRVLQLGGRGREMAGTGPLSSEPVTALLLVPGTRRVLAATRGRGLFASDDLGATFRARPRVGADGSMLALVGVPGRAHSVLAFTDDGVWHSPDAGESFERWSAPTDVDLFAGLRAAVVHPDDHRLWLVAARGGLLRSLDGGRSWRPADALAPGTRARSLAFEPTAPHRLFLLAEAPALPPEPAGPSPLAWSDDAGRSFSFIPSRRLDRARDPSGEITSLALWRDHDRTLAGLGTDRGEILVWRGGGGDGDAERVADALPPVVTLATVAAARALDPSTSGIFLLP